MLIKITRDLFDIASRLKEIDENYQVYYDTKKSVYALFNGGRRQLNFPFETLDVRALDYAWETRIERLDEMEKKVDCHNARVLAEAVKKAQDEVENRASKLL